MGLQETFPAPLQASVFKGEKHLRGPGAAVRQTTGISQVSTAQPESDSGDPISLLPQHQTIPLTDKHRAVANSE